MRPPEPPPSWHLARAVCLYLFINLLTPLAQDWRPLRPGAGHVLALPRSPASAQCPARSMASACCHGPGALAQPRAHTRSSEHPSPPCPSVSSSQFPVVPCGHTDLFPRPVASLAGALPLNPLHRLLGASQLLFSFKKGSLPQKPYCSKLRLVYMLVLAWCLHFSEHSLGEIRFCIVEDIVSRCGGADQCGLSGCVIGPVRSQHVSSGGASLKHPRWPHSRDSHGSLREASLLEEAEA